MAMPKQPTIGLIVPYSTDDLPPECSTMYPDVRFLARGVGVERLAADSYEAAMTRVPAAAAALADAATPDRRDALPLPPPATTLSQKASPPDTSR